MSEPKKEKLNELHLFAGAGGGILGGILLGHTTVCAVEIEPYCRKVLLQRQRDGILPKFPIWDDVKTFDGEPWRGRVDVVCGGFPCQDISAAGKGAGINGERSGLWREMARIIGEVRSRFVFIENSPLLRTRGLQVVLRDLAEMGYDAKWCVLGAKTVGAFHERERIWILAIHANGYGIQASQSFVPVLATKNALAGYARHLAGTVGMDGLPGFVASGLQRKGDAVAGCMDRFKAIGNGQVPAVAALAWRILSEGVIE